MQCGCVGWCTVGSMLETGPAATKMSSGSEKFRVSCRAVLRSVPTLHRSSHITLRVSSVRWLLHYTAGEGFDVPLDIIGIDKQHSALRALQLRLRRVITVPEAQVQIAVALRREELLTSDTVL